MVSAGAARCSPAEGQGRNGVPAGRQYAVSGGAALVPRGPRVRLALFCQSFVDCTATAPGGEWRPASATVGSGIDLCPHGQARDGLSA